MFFLVNRCVFTIFFSVLNLRSFFSTVVVSRFFSSVPNFCNFSCENLEMEVIVKVGWDANP